MEKAFFLVYWQTVLEYKYRFLFGVTFSIASVSNLTSMPSINNICEALYLNYKWLQAVKSMWKNQHVQVITRHFVEIHLNCLDNVREQTGQDSVVGVNFQQGKSKIITKSASCWETTLDLYFTTLKGRIDLKISNNCVLLPFQSIKKLEILKTIVLGLNKSFFSTYLGQHFWWGFLDSE